MSNIDIYKEYIQDSIINHLERLMGNDEVDEAARIAVVYVFVTSRCDG